MRMKWKRRESARAAGASAGGEAPSLRYRYLPSPDLGRARQGEARYPTCLALPYLTRPYTCLATLPTSTYSTYSTLVPAAPPALPCPATPGLAWPGLACKSPATPQVPSHPSPPPPLPSVTHSQFHVPILSAEAISGGDAAHKPVAAAVATSGALSSYRPNRKPFAFALILTRLVWACFSL